MITTQEINALKGIVGDRWVETDACMMDTYSFYMNPEVLTAETGGRFTPRPEAVAMPSSTEEVSEIVKYCNTTDLMVKPFSTGAGTWAAASRERVVILDLRRMDKIIDIDEKNQIAVIEPYVRAIDLQTELMEQGLNVHVVSAGGQHSILASTVAAWGYGCTGPSMSYSGRNLLGVEWVLPTGEIVTLGSGGSDAFGWFTADGPGPSLRGVVRGFAGTMGGLGVFTKCAVKLYKWDGPSPSEFKMQGASPDYVLEKKPPNMSMNGLAFPDLERMKDAGYKLGEAEIEYGGMKGPFFLMALNMTENNEELKVVLDSGLLQKVGRYVLVNAVVAHSKGEYKWKMKALKQILRETKGVRLPMKFMPPPKLMGIMGKLIKPLKNPLAVMAHLPFLQTIINNLPVYAKQEVRMFSHVFLMIIRHATITQGVFRGSQGMATSMGSFDTWDVGVNQNQWFIEKKKEYIAKNEELILDDEGDMGCGNIYENAHMGYMEGVVLYDPKNPRSIQEVGKLTMESINAMIDNAYGVPIQGFGVPNNALFGPECYNYDRWLKKIKASLDPNTASDPFFYSEPEISESEK